jgi:hypothetical protein
MKLIVKTRNSVLLEDETGYRFYVEKRVYETGDAELIRHFAIPYSLPFDFITGIEIESELYKVGVHTLEDILNNRRSVLKVMKNTDVTVEQLIELVKGDNSNGR